MTFDQFYKVVTKVCRLTKFEFVHKIFFQNLFSLAAAVSNKSFHEFIFEARNYFYFFYESSLKIRNRLHRVLDLVKKEVPNFLTLCAARRWTCTLFF